MTTKIERVAVIGTGMMGPGIAAVIALAGFPVTLIGERPDWAKDGVNKAHALMDQLLANDLATSAAVAAAKSSLRGTAELALGVKDVQLVIEAIAENLDAKQQMFKQLEALTPPDVILATNTSGLSITAISARVTIRSRCATTHFWMPPHLVPLVEIVMSPDTSEETAQSLVQFIQRCGKKPALVRKDVPGQLAGRIFQAMIREATNMVQEGIASAADVDTAVKNGFGIRLPVWGVLEHVDAVSLDLCLPIQNTVLPTLNNVPQATHILADKVAQGDLGVKSGKGFYDWSVKDIDKLVKARDEFIIQALKFRSQHTPG
jgi:3-hydroxybutyryl-CoA dehydrogenase